MKMNNRLLRNFVRAIFVCFVFMNTTYALAKGQYYYFSNQWLKDSVVMTLNNQGLLVMAPKDTKNEKQLWKMVKESNGSFRIHNKSLGDGKALDSNHEKPHMANKGNYNGQYWYLTPTNNGWYRLSNMYQGKKRVIDSDGNSSSGNFLRFEAASKNTTGTFWKYVAAPTELALTTTTINIPTDVNLNEPLKPIKPIIINPYIPNTSTETIHVSGIDPNWEYLNFAPCKARQSTSKLLSQRNGMKLPNSNCSRRTGKPSDLSYFHTTQSEYEQVSKLFVHLEETFINALKEDPSRVLNYDDGKLASKLKVSKGKVSYSELEAFVYGELLNSLRKPRNKRTAIEQTAVDWLVRGGLSAELMIWKAAQEQYKRWRLDPCSYSPPGIYSRARWDGMYANCGGSANPLASAFKLGEKQQAHPKVSDLVKWGAYIVGEKILADRQTALLNRSISMGSVYIVGAAAFTGAAVTTTVVLGSGVIAASIFPFSTSIAAAGGLFSLSATGTFAAAPTALGAGALAGPAVVVVGAVVGTVAAITMTAEDVAFHNRMNTDELIFNLHGTPVKLSKISFNKAVDLYSLRIQGKTYFPSASDFEKFALTMNGAKPVEETNPSGAIEFAFSDAMNPLNPRKFLPVTVPVPLVQASTIQQKNNGRYLDAHENTNDNSAVTRGWQNNDSQRWIVKKVKDNIYTIQQKNNGRYLDAHENSNDYSAVTRGWQKNDSQRWIVKKVKDNIYTIQQKINGRYLDAHENSNDYSAVTRGRQKNDSQRWIINPPLPQ